MNMQSTHPMSAAEHVLDRQHVRVLRPKRPLLDVKGALKQWPANVIVTLQGKIVRRA